MRELFWLTDKQLQTLSWMLNNVVIVDATCARLNKMIEREIKARA